MLPSSYQSEVHTSYLFLINNLKVNTSGDWGMTWIFILIASQNFEVNGAKTPTFHLQLYQRLRSFFFYFFGYWFSAVVFFRNFSAWVVSHDFLFPLFFLRKCWNLDFLEALIPSLRIRNKKRYSIKRKHPNRIWPLVVRVMPLFWTRRWVSYEPIWFSFLISLYLHNVFNSLSSPFRFFFFVILVFFFFLL